MTAQLPSDTHAINDTGHVTDHNNIVDVLTLLTGTAAGGTPTAQGILDNIAGGITNAHYLRANGTHVILDSLKVNDIGNLLANSAGFTPANPASTTSTTLVMMGLGASVTYHPIGTGIVTVQVAGTGATASAGVGFNVGIRYNTGTAPAHGAAVTGTTAGADITDHGSGTSQVGWASCARLALTAGSTYWFDIALSTSNAADAASVSSVMFVIQEQFN